jgi:hypothetical protein
MGYSTRLPDGRRDPTYVCWFSMKDRCHNPRSRNYRRYGARGITVCQRWRESFKNFLADMGPKPPGLELDRTNNEGHYEPANCRWVTAKVNARNRRNNRFVTYNGETRTTVEWAEVAGLPVKVFRSRLRNGWSIEEALTRPKFPQGGDNRFRRHAS